MKQQRTCFFFFSSACAWEYQSDRKHCGLGNYVVIVCWKQTSCLPKLQLRWTKIADKSLYPAWKLRTCGANHLGGTVCTWTRMGVDPRFGRGLRSDSASFVSHFHLGSASHSAHSNQKFSLATSRTSKLNLSDTWLKHWTHGNVRQLTGSHCYPCYHMARSATFSMSLQRVTLSETDFDWQELNPCKEKMGMNWGPSE